MSGWVDAIAGLYRLNELRLQASANAQTDTPPGQPQQLVLEPAAPTQVALEQAVQAMATRRATELADPTLAEPATKVLRSMGVHWNGLTVFVARPWVPMDNNAENASFGPRSSVARASTGPAPSGRASWRPRCTAC